MKKSVTLVALFLVGLVLGGVVGGGSSVEKDLRGNFRESADGRTLEGFTADGSSLTSTSSIRSGRVEEKRPSKVRLLLDRLRGAKAKDFPVIWEEMIAEERVAGQFRVQFDRSEKWQLVICEWASVDALGAWDYLRETAGGHSVKGSLAAAWLARDSAAALEVIAAEPWADIDSWIQGTLARHDPQFAMAHWKAGAGDGKPPPIAILAAMAKTDPQAVIALLDEHDDNYRSSSLSRLARSWPIDRLDELVSIISAGVGDSKSASGGRPRSGMPKALGHAYSNLGSRLVREFDPEAGIDAILSTPAGGGRDVILKGFLGYRRVVAPEVLARIAQLPEAELAEFGNFNQLLKARYDDYAQTWDWLESLPPEVGKKAFASGLDSFAEEWAMSDPQSAADKLADLVSGEARDDFVAGLATGIGRSVPDMAIPLLSQIPEESRGEYAREFADACARHHPDKLVEILASADDPELKRALQRGGFKAIALDDPVAAAELVFEVSEGEDEVYRNTRAVIERWVERDPAAAEQWVHALPDGIRDDAIGDLGESVGARDPREATRIYLKIEDPDSRRAYLEEHLGELYFVNPQAAREHLEGLPVEDAERVMLMEMLEVEG